MFDMCIHPFSFDFLLSGRRLRGVSNYFEDSLSKLCLAFD